MAIGTFKKDGDSWYTRVTHTLEHGATVSISAKRDTVCKKLVVGKKIVPSAPERIIPAMPEHEEDIVEWECPESFLAMKDEVEPSITE